MSDFLSGLGGTTSLLFQFLDYCVINMFSGDGLEERVNGLSATVNYSDLSCCVTPTVTSLAILVMYHVLNVCQVKSLFFLETERVSRGYRHYSSWVLTSLGIL